MYAPNRAHRVLSRLRIDAVAETMDLCARGPRPQTVWTDRRRSGATRLLATDARRVRWRFLRSDGRMHRIDGIAARLSKQGHSL
jgi:hypothetical protein